MKTKSLYLLLLIILVTSACASSVVPTKESPNPIVTDESLPVQSPTETAPIPEQSASTAWKAIRDNRYGFGLAVPCWWLVSPIPAEGFGGVMTIKNFDEAYFNANSTKGFWNWPNGALKLDVIVMEGIDPAKSDADAYMEFVDPSTNGLVSAEPLQIGANTLTVLTLSNLVNTNDPDTQMFVYRLAPDKLLMIVAIPQSIINTPDFQAILASIVLSPEAQIALPTITPAPALIDASCAQ
jgi:hypothetical protein